MTIHCPVHLPTGHFGIRVGRAAGPAFGRAVIDFPTSRVLRPRSGESLIPLCLLLPLLVQVAHPHDDQERDRKGNPKSCQQPKDYNKYRHQSFHHDPPFRFLVRQPPAFKPGTEQQDHPKRDHDPDQGQEDDCKHGVHMYLLIRF